MATLLKVEKMAPNSTGSVMASGPEGRTMASSPNGSGIVETAIDFIEGEKNSVDPIDLHVRKLSYTVTDKPGSWWQKLTHVQMPWEWMEKGKTTHVLQDVSFTARSGQVLAIMGGSGSGKTSLLDVLAYRTTAGTVSGQVFLNSSARTKTLLTACSGYVRQDDRLLDFLTARETLMFVAQLKLPRSFTSDMIKTRVDMVISELGLKHAADTKVGGASLRGLSGGERRRVSIGIQLLILPSILFLDEPTSGLDSFTAANLVQTLSRLAVKERTIIMSIHQPRIDIFNIVDSVMILSKGKIVFSGLGNNIVPYFTSLGFPCPAHTNPCDFYIDLATVDGTSREQEEVSSQTVKRLQDAYKESADKRFPEDEFHNQQNHTNGFKKTVPAVGNLEGLTLGRDKAHNSSVKEDDRFGPRLPFQFYILLRRFIRVKADNYATLLTHTLQATAMSLLLGAVYVELQLDPQSMRDWFAVMFMASVMYPFMVILGLISACHEERKFMYFELQDRLYNTSAYYFAKIVSDIPFHLVYVLIYCVPVYCMAGLKMEALACFLFYLFVSVSVFTSRCMAMMSAALLPTYQLSSMLAQIFFSLFIMSAGFFIHMDSFLSGTKWMSKVSYLRWSYQALCIVQIKNLEFGCNNCTQATVSGNDALRMYGLDGIELWECALGLGLSMLVFLVVTFLGLKFIPQKPHDEHGL